MMKFTRYPAQDKYGLVAFASSEGAPDFQTVHITKEIWDDLENHRSISVIKAEDNIPETWYSVWKGVGGGRWMEIGVVDSLQTAQALLNTMQTGRIMYKRVQIEIKNSHINDQ